MLKFTIFAVCFASMFAANFVACEQSGLDANVEFTVVSNLTEFLRENPKIKLLRPLIRDEPSTKAQITYRLGSRVSGDRLVATNSQSQQWSSPQDVRLTLTYPQNGTGATVSYVDMLVDQSSNVGRGYVVSGGIGQRTLSLIIEARATTYFRHTVNIFGY